MTSTQKKPRRFKGLHAILKKECVKILRVGRKLPGRLSDRNNHREHFMSYTQRKVQSFIGVERQPVGMKRTLRCITLITCPSGFGGGIE